MRALNLFEIARCFRKQKIVEPEADDLDAEIV